MKALDETREESAHSDAVRAHDHRPALALRIGDVDTECVGVPGPELKDVADFHAAFPLEASTAVHAKCFVAGQFAIHRVAAVAAHADGVLTDVEKGHELVRTPAAHQSRRRLHHRDV